uniref:NADH-ubiquinone oxidoreductase chain 2 n=1 Tax=Bolanusoides shaanxiensis TaxID=2691008 RepID=A0A6B9M6M3_9HEMI|nr:NADH dehydrogenase subunit 2 [Bolanusoides shaanxiensis]
MKKNSSKLLFYSMMMTGIMMTISANNWIMMWCGLEISLISFMPLMISKLMISSESSMKYFIVQSISSSMLMLSMLIMVMSGDYNYNYLFTTAMLIKTGVPPFHNWVLTVIEGLELKSMFMLLTINKIAPLTLMSYLIMTITIIILMTIMVGATMGLNQNSVKKLMGYSSIFNMGLILSVIKINTMWMVYLLIYSTILMMMLMIVKKTMSMYVNQMIFSETILNKMNIWISMLSMGGMPPLMGFSIKYMVLMQLIQSKMIITASIMIITSLIMMFMYLRITFMSIMSNSITSKMKLFKLNEMSMMSITINMTTLTILMITKV